jgi:hypothetical protein
MSIYRVISISFVTGTSVDLLIMTFFRKLICCIYSKRIDSPDENRTCGNGVAFKQKDQRSCCKYSERRKYKERLVINRLLAIIKLLKVIDETHTTLTHAQKCKFRTRLKFTRAFSVEFVFFFHFTVTWVGQAIYGNNNHSTDIED